MLAESAVVAASFEANFREIETCGYSVGPFVEPAEIKALLDLHRRTTAVVLFDYFPTAFGNEARRQAYEGFTSILGSKIEQLLPGRQVVMASFVTKKAHSSRGRLVLHQDYSLVDHKLHLGLNVWAPLGDVDKRNGCMCMVERSHLFNHISAMPPNPRRYSGLHAELEARYLTSAPMAAGKAPGLRYALAARHRGERDLQEPHRGRAEHGAGLGPAEAGLLERRHAQAAGGVSHRHRVRVEDDA